MSSFVPNTSPTLSGNNKSFIYVAGAEHDGYPTLAWLMSSYPDKAVFRRFGELNLLNLLRLQAELQEMEHQLKVIRKEDAESRDPTRACYAKDFRAMRDNQELGDSEQYELLIQVGLKLQEYSTHELFPLTLGVN
jgi:hypothetical protein